MLYEDKDKIIQQLKTQLQDLKGELTKTIQANQAYQSESKQLEQFLQNQIKKRQAQTRKVKDQLHKKQKINTEGKSKVLDLERQLKQKNKQFSQLTQKLNKANIDLNLSNERTIKMQKNLQQAGYQIQSKNNQIKKLEQQMEILNRNNQELQKQIQNKEIEFNQQKKSNKSPNSKQINLISNSKQIEEIKRLKDLINKSKKKQDSSTEINNNLKLQNQKLQQQLQLLQHQLQLIQQQGKTNINSLKKSKSKPFIQMMQDVGQFKKLQRAYRELKLKYTQLLEERKQLIKSIKQLQKKHVEQIQRDIYKQSIFQQKNKDKDNIFHILIKTKKHYISPFLEINGKNLKLLKQTKTGFDRSLGAYKASVDYLSYYTQEVCNSVIQNLNINRWLEKQKEESDTIIIFGSKRSSKKQILINILKIIKEKLPKFIQQKQINFKIKFIKTKLNETPQVYLQFDSDNQQQRSLDIKAILQNILQILEKKEEFLSPRKSKIVSKNKILDQIRFFQMIINDNYRLEIITSNNSGVGFKQNDSLNNSLKNLVFSAIPAIQINQRSRRYIILPINPIVQQYQQCKLSLLLINQQYKSEKKSQEHIFSQHFLNRSPIKQDMMINENVKKKIENLEKQNEQLSLKIKKLEQQCSFYKIKIQQFMIRIKNIISSQNQQITYLKKSPITLTLQKLERSMTVILQRNFNSNKAYYLDRQKFYQLNQEYDIEKFEEGLDLEGDNGQV